MKIITFPGIREKAPEEKPVATVLAEATSDLSSGFVCGYSRDGSFYFNSSIADAAQVAWLANFLIHKMVTMVEGPDPSFKVT